MPLIKISLLLLTALCANVYAGADKNISAEEMTTSDKERHGHTVVFATILHNIDISSCYTWLTKINQSNAHKMINSLMAQLWKIVWLGMFGMFFQDNISFKYAFLSKFAIDILVRGVRNSKIIATMLSHWPIGLALVHCCALPNAKNFFWGPYYEIFVFFFGIYYVFQKCYQPLSKIIIGDQSQRSNVSYLFDIGLGIVCIAAPAIPELLVGLFCMVFPFVVLLLEYFIL